MERYITDLIRKVCSVAFNFCTSDGFTYIF
uniref:Uncharacterized protein n=1 Tax=Arundo donax TaxID=35708 RepID=A0A0A9GSH4_ARUDO